MLKYIKKTYLMSIVSTIHNPRGYAGEAVNHVEEQNPFEGGASKDLKQLKEYLKDGVVNSEEAKIIADNLDKIDGLAQQGLNEVAHNMLDNGFETKQANVYDSFSKIMGRVNVNIPSWNKILSSAGLPITVIKAGDSSFHGIKVKKSNSGLMVELKYDKWGRADLYRVYADKQGNIINGEWPSGEGDNEDVKEGGIVDKKTQSDVDTYLTQAEKVDKVKMAQKNNEKVEKMSNIKKSLKSLIEKYPGLEIDLNVVGKKPQKITYLGEKVAIMDFKDGEKDVTNLKNSILHIRKLQNKKALEVGADFSSPKEMEKNQENSLLQKLKKDYKIDVRGEDMYVVKDPDGREQTFSSGDAVKDYLEKTYQIYHIQKGDTLWALAKKSGILVNKLIDINKANGINPKKLRIGSKFILPKKEK